MIDLGAVRESDVVFAFLKAEIDYSDQRQQIQQFLQALGVSRQELLDDRNRDNDYYNAIRALALESFRGYLSRRGVFTRFPKEVYWRRVELEPAELAGRLKYVRSKEWWPLSDGTRQPQRVVEKIARGELSAPFVQKVASIEERLKLGEALPELVAVEGHGVDLILVEGAHRTTAYVNLGWTKNVPAFIGSSARMRDWEFY
jgi:hypothetical protein